ncbi:hypothetical protein QBC35DRAFT_441815 [Podospora australis]|uniref:Microbial-type PARG catalytic domain-containing protein n=1 Tax=Podospora australis TaxID=1536484 RepID=A0AAN7AFR8_9PEZI|nr:hypothetical protein QBC35DRAFT_441815 [Podospora australis]
MATTAAHSALTNELVAHLNAVLPSLHIMNEGPANSATRTVRHIGPVATALESAYANAVDVTAVDVVDLVDLPPLDPAKCPRFKLGYNEGYTYGTWVDVLTSIDQVRAASYILSPDHDDNDLEHRPFTSSLFVSLHEYLRDSAEFPENIDPVNGSKIALLNMANDTEPAGRFLAGDDTSETSLCQRSTLYASLRKAPYPWGSDTRGLYSRDVTFFETFLNYRNFPHKLPLCSVISMAGVDKPPVRTDPQNPNIRRFADPKHRDRTKQKMRLFLKFAAHRGHTLLVVGTFGCDSHRANPEWDVVQCWMEVMSEKEFRIGWFKEIHFALPMWPLYQVFNELKNKMYMFDHK